MSKGCPRAYTNVQETSNDDVIIVVVFVRH
jgi:hypothetical protein